MVGFTVSFEKRCFLSFAHLPRGFDKQLPNAVGDSILAVLGHQDDMRIQIVDYMPTYSVIFLLGYHVWYYSPREHQAACLPYGG